MKTIFIIWITFFTLIHAGLTDDAYSAYKKGDKIKAFELYKKGDKQGNSKATYNLAVFYEKGIGTAKNLPKALELYKKVISPIRNSIDYCTSSHKRYYKKTFKKLAQYEHDPKYNKQMNTFETQCKYHEYPTMDDDKAFIKKCPSAKITPKKYRREIFHLPCKYFKRYPKIMRKYMPLYVQIKKYRNNDWKKAKNLEKKLQKLVYPIIRDLKKQEIHCYTKAKTAGDAQSCSMQYIAKLDTLFITDISTGYADSMHLYGTKNAHKKEEAERQRILTKEERKEMLKKERQVLRTGDIIPEDFKLNLP